MVSSGGLLTSLYFLGCFLVLLGYAGLFFFLAGKNKVLMKELKNVSKKLQEKNHREEEARKNLFFQSALSSLRKIALSMGTFKSLLGETVNLIKETMDVQAVQVLVYDREKGTFTLEEGWGWEGDLLGKLRFPAEARYVETLALAAKGCQAWAYSASSPEFSPSPHVASHGFRASLNVSIPGGEGPWGVLSVFRKEEKPFSVEESSFIEIVADILGDAFRVQSTVLKLKNEEERLDMVLKGANLGTWSWEIPEDRLSMDGRFTSLLEEGDGGCEISPEEFRKRVHEEDLGPMKKAREDHFEGKAKSFDWVGRIRTEGGEWRWFHILGRILERDQNGEPCRMAGVAQDITEKKRLEDQLFQAQKLESVGRLAAGIAHEINTPAQYVSDNTMFLKESGIDLLEFARKVEKLLLEEYRESLPAEVKEKFQALLEELDMEFLLEEVPKAIDQSLEGLARVTKIVRAMKEFSHPGSAVQEPTDLNKAIQSTATIARNEWKYVSDLEMDLDPDLPLVRCYGGDFNQVILNLIVNAAHAIGEVVKDKPGEKGKIKVSTRKDGDWAEIRVEDTGTGIPKEIRHKIFEPFFTTKPVGKGTGQGLSLVYSVITGKHGGEVGLESEEGKGTTFILRIPIEGKKEGQEKESLEEEPASL